MLKLIIWPDKILEVPSVPIDINTDDNIKGIVSNMFEVMYHYKGVGLSAVQVGLPLRIFVMDCSNQLNNLKENIEPKPLVLINPEIKKRIGDRVLMEEGCLSFPGIIETAFRYPEIIIEATNLEGELIKYQMAGLEAQCADHEMDHLEGLTMGDQWGRVKRGIMVRKIKKTLK